LIEQAAAKKSRKAPTAGALLDAACRIVLGEGLAGLTLRPLADMLGVSVTVLTTHYGVRADIIAAICNAACAQDALLLERWRGMLAALPPLPPAMAADLADAILEEQATQQRAVSMLYLELLHGCTWDPALQPAFAAWRAQRRAFWDEFGRRAGLSPALLGSGWWHGYAVAELAYSMALNTLPPYRVLRRLCLQRLFDGGVASAPDAADSALFSLLFDQMQAGAAAAGPASVRAPEWSALAARACGMRLAAQGVSGLTHRAIAAEIGVPHTTLSYRFPTQRELVMAGLEFIAAHILTAVNADSLTDLQRLRTEGDGQKLDLARANFAMAIAAARMPGLAAYTAGMRSRRGNNLVKVFGKYMPAARGVDALCAQVVSMGLTGLTNTEPPGEASERSVASAFSAAADWLREAGQPYSG
jgi:AcrR family transcriptional regulator